MSESLKSLNPNRTESQLSDLDKAIIEQVHRVNDTPESIAEEIENVYDYAKTLNEIGNRIDRIETAARAMGIDDDSWADPDEGIDGGAALVKLAQRVHAKEGYVLSANEEKFLDYEDSVIKVEEASASINDAKLREKYPSTDNTEDALYAHVSARLENDRKNQARLDDPATAEEAKEKYKGDPRKLPGVIINEERTQAYIEKREGMKNYGNELLDAIDAVAALSTEEDSPEKAQALKDAKKAERKALRMTAAAQTVNFSVADTLTNIAREFPNEGEDAYKSPTIIDQEVRAEEAKNRRRRADGRARQNQNNTQATDDAANGTPSSRPEGKRARRNRRNADTQAADPTNIDDDEEQTDDTQASGNQAGATGATNANGNASGNTTGNATSSNTGNPTNSGNAAPANTGNTSGNNGNNNNGEREESKKSPEYIRQERLLLGVQRGLAAAQAELTSNMNPFQRKDLKNKVAKLEVEYDKLVKRVSILELRDDETFKEDLASNPSDVAEIIGQAVENKVSMRYDQLANMTGELQGSTTMDFLEKHGTKIALGATALGGIVGLGVGGAVTGAAVGLGLKVMTKRYHAQKGRNIGKMTNFKGVDSNGQTFYSNNKLRESIQTELAKIHHGITSADTPQIRALKERVFVNNLFDEAFRAGTIEARHEYNTAVQREFTRGYLGSIAAGMATSAAVYVGGHVAGNMLHYQLFGGPGSARWTMSTLDSQGQGVTELLGKVGYDPSSMSLWDSAWSNFAPFGR